MNFNFFKKLFTTKRLMITFLSLLAVFVVSLLIYGYDSMHDPEKVKARLYACGKFGDQQMLIDKQYLHYARVAYGGVNYWGKNIKKEPALKGKMRSSKDSMDLAGRKATVWFQCPNRRNWQPSQ